MEFGLTADQENMIASTRKLVDRVIRPVLAKHPQGRALPKQELVAIFKVLAEQGILTPRLPEEGGGTGLSLLDCGLAFEQIPPSISMSMLSQDSFVARVFAECGPAQREQWLPDVIAGRKLACTGSTEPDTGSDPRGIKTRLRREGDMGILNGQKMWVTNVSVCDVILVTCTEESPKDGRQKVIKILVDREKSPFEAREIDAIGLNQGFLGEAVFADCRVPLANIVESDSGTKVLNKSWNLNRALVGLQAVHLAQRAFEQALEYSKVRRQFGKPIGAHQLVQKNLSDIATAITTSRYLCYRTLWMMDQGQEVNGTAAMTKRYAQMACREAVWQSMNIMGAMGLSREAGLEALYRDIRMLPIPDGTNEILALIHGRELTGFEAFRGVAAN